MPETLYAIVDSAQLGSLNFSKLNQDAPASCRKSLDGANAIISFNGIQITPQLFSGEMLVEETSENIELYGPTGDASLLSGIFQSIPFSQELANMAYAGASKTEIKQVALNALGSGIITEEQVPQIKQGLIRYAPKNNDPKTNLNKDFFDDVTGVVINNAIVFNETSQKLNSYNLVTRSGDYEIEENYNIVADQYFNLKSIIKLRKVKKYQSNLDFFGNVLEAKRNENGSFTTGIKYNKDGCLGPISNNIKTYNAQEIKSVLTGCEWTSIEPIVTNVTPVSGGFNDVITINGDNFYNITGIGLGDYNFEINSIAPTQITFTLPSVASDANIKLLGSYENFQTSFYFDYINELPALDSVSVSEGTLTINGSRLDNVKFVTFAPDANNEEPQKIGYPFFNSQISSKISLTAPEYTGAYTVSLIDIEDRLIY